jgi:hypothetical protein
VKRFLPILTLACVLSAPVIAGEIPTSGAPVPGPNTSTASTGPGEIPTSGAPTPATDPGEIPSIGMSAVLEVLRFLV